MNRLIFRSPALFSFASTNGEPGTGYFDNLSGSHHQRHLTLTITFPQVVETSVTITDNSLSEFSLQGYPHLDDHTTRSLDTITLHDRTTRSHYTIALHDHTTRSHYTTDTREVKTTFSKDAVYLWVFGNRRYDVLNNIYH